MYDPNWVREQYQNQWEMQFGEIAPDQNWNMAKKIEANLAIQEDALSEYTFKVYTANPLYETDAKLIAKTKVTTNAEGFAQTSLAFDVLTTSKSVYVVRVDDHGRRLLKAYELKDNTLDVRFGTTALNSRAVEEGNLPTMTCPYTVEQVNNLIADGYDVKNGLTYLNQYNSYSTLDAYNKLPLLCGGTIAVVSDTQNALNTYVYEYYTKGPAQQDWQPYTEVYNPITGPGIVKVVVADGGYLKYNNQNIVGMDIIVASGGTLELNNCFNMGDNARLIVMPGGTVVDKTTYGYSLQNNAASSLVYIGGTIKNMRSFLLNVGTTYIAETGVLTGEEINFADVAVMTNWGKIDVARVKGNGNQGTLNNGCLLRSDELVQVSILNQNANTALECNTIYANSITLRNNSIVRSKNLNMNGNGAYIAYVGTDESSALISTQKITLASATTYKKPAHLYIEANEYADTNTSWGLDHSGVNNAKVGESKFAIFPAYKGEELEKADCTGKGNIPTDYVPEQKDETQTWIVACEDLGAVGDFDFNDIVFRVSHLAGNDTVHIQALAAGGTLQAVLCHEEAGELGEIHGLFGFTDVTMMVNTGVGYNWNGRNNYNGKVIDIKVPTDFTMATNMGGFYLKIYNGDKEVETEIGPSQGVAPQMICAPGDWKWPLEVVNIGDAYPGFGEWGAGYENGGTWYEGGVTENLYDENIIY